MFDLYEMIPAWIRGGFAVALIVLGIVCCFSGYGSYEKLKADEKRSGNARDPYADRSARTSFQGGIVVTLLGCGLLAISGRGRAEANGYHF